MFVYTLYTWTHKDCERRCPRLCETPTLIPIYHIQTYMTWKDIGIVTCSYIPKEIYSLLVYNIFLAVLQGAVAMTFKLRDLGIVLAESSQL